MGCCLLEPLSLCTTTWDPCARLLTVQKVRGLALSPGSRFNARISCQMSNCFLPLAAQCKNTPYFYASFNTNICSTAPETWLETSPSCVTLTLVKSVEPRCRGSDMASDDWRDPMYHCWPGRRGLLHNCHVSANWEWQWSLSPNRHSTLVLVWLWICACVCVCVRHMWGPTSVLTVMGTCIPYGGQKANPLHINH